MSDATLKSALVEYLNGFGGGMIPFDDAYWKAVDGGLTAAEAQRHGVEAVLQAFVLSAEAHLQ